MVDSGELTSSDSQPQEHHLRLAVPSPLEKLDNRFTDQDTALNQVSDATTTARTAIAEMGRFGAIRCEPDTPSVRLTRRT